MVLVYFARTYQCSLYKTQQISNILSKKNMILLGHTGEKKYVCRNCGKHFRTSSEAYNCERGHQVLTYFTYFPKFNFGDF